MGRYLRKYGLLACLFFTGTAMAQNSVLINFGGVACDNGLPVFSMISNPLGATPAQVATCLFYPQVPNIQATFIAYNPLNNKVYIADNRSDTATKIWVLDIGLPGAITCPASIPVEPSYSYPYISNNFEFDNNGTLWSLSNYNATTGQGNIDQFDVNTGNIIRSKTLQFSAGNFPTNVENGDITILPNGRMFTCLGTNPCRLYEITGYSDNAASATGSFLQALPRNCFGLSYLGGTLEAAGSLFDGVNCYYYDYNIATGVLGTEKPFQTGLLPIDNASLTPALGCTKRLLSSSRVNSNTADLVYEIFMENLGNVILNNINVTDDLAATFGAGNVSNVSVSFVPGSNAAGLLLNPLYNGTSVTTLLNSGQNIKNKVLSNQDYFVKLQVSCRASNLAANTTYLNSAIAAAEIGTANSRIAVSDSSNNGDTSRVDPNKNGNAGDPGENVPTPFSLTVLPVRFINVAASLAGNNTAQLNWQVATPMINAASFVVEYSTDGRHWLTAGEIKINDPAKSNWQFVHQGIPPGNIYYRIRQVDTDGTFTYSRVVLVKNKANAVFVVYPNPARTFIAVSSGYEAVNKANLQLLDATGRILLTKTVSSSNEEISTAAYPDGTYILRIIHAEEAVNYKVVIRH